MKKFPQIPVFLFGALALMMIYMMDELMIVKGKVKKGKIMLTIDGIML